jgi:glycosyltransferase involved in cell wall biosynthesis
MGETTKRLKAAFVVQRYGLEVCGGSELLCRQLAEHMVKHWDIEVLTSCAVDHLTWKNEYPAGRSEVNGIRVLRFPVDAPRDTALFDELSARVLSRNHSPEDEREWVLAQGPHSTTFNECIRSRCSCYDLFVFFTYLYAFTVHGLPAAQDRSLLVPTAHDEPPIYLDIYRELFRLPRGLAFNTPWEQDFVNRHFGTRTIPQDVIGVGIEQPATISGQRFIDRHREKLQGHEFLLCAGRIDPNKGSYQLFSYFMRFRDDVPGYPLKLLLIGSSAIEVPSHPDIVYLGFVTEAEKFDAIAAAQLVLLPSVYESLSLVALEAWQLGKPVLVNGACEVLRQQCLRSNGGLWYQSYAEFREAALLFMRQPEFRRQVGQSGRAFVEQHYRWDMIETKYLNLAEMALRGRPTSRPGRVEAHS